VPRTKQWPAWEGGCESPPAGGGMHQGWQGGKGGYGAVRLFSTNLGEPDPTRANPSEPGRT